MDLPEDTLNTLICHQCRKYLSIFPIFLYSDGNLVCGRCPLKLPGDARHLTAYESIAKLMRFPCKNQEFGCFKMLTPDNLKTHEDKCDFKQWKCHQVCEWEGLLSNVKEHYQDHHPEHLICHNEYFKLSLEDNTSLIILLYTNYNSFLVQLFKQDCELSICVQMVHGSLTFEVYKYELHFLCESTDVVLNVPQAAVDKMINKVELRKIHLKGIDINELSSCKISISNTDEIQLSSPNHSILQQLKCTVCCEFARCHIYHCREGHIVCGTCKTKACSKCKKTLSITRLFALENIAKNIMFPCKHSQCNLLFKYDEYDEHLMKCKFKSYKCPLCEFTSQFDELFKHLRDNHNSNVYHGKIDMEIDFNKTITEPNQFVIIKKDFIYIVNHHFPDNTSTFKISVNQYGNRDQCKQFFYELSIENHFLGEQVFIKSMMHTVNLSYRMFNNKTPLWTFKINFHEI